MRKKFFIVLFSCSIFSSGCNENIIDAGEYGTGDDYEIYKKILIEKYSESGYLIVLNDSTFGEHYDSLTVPYFCGQIPGLYAETVIDYININNERIKLRNIPGFKNYVFSSKYQEKEINATHIAFSRIGYDKSKSQAVLTIAQSYRGWDGSGFLYFMKKEGNRWRIDKIIGTWIS
ncbi:MAG: hypothetical protein ACM34O_16030 [Ignavibacteria bacterium]